MKKLLDSRDPPHFHGDTFAAFNSFTSCVRIRQSVSRAWHAEPLLDGTEGFGQCMLDVVWPTDLLAADRVGKGAEAR